MTSPKSKKIIYTGIDNPNLKSLAESASEFLPKSKSVVEEIREMIDASYADNPPLHIHASEDNYATGRIKTLESLIRLIQKRDAEQGYLLKEVTDKLRYITIRLESLASEKEQEGVKE
mgnify:CR=1 FL=1